MNKRKEFTTTTKLAAWDLSGGFCRSCERKIFPGDGPEYDHIITCEQGGDNALINCQVLCISCHSDKTRLDAGASAKSRHVRASHVNAKTTQTMMGSRKSGWKRTLNNGWVRR